MNVTSLDAPLAGTLWYIVLALQYGVTLSTEITWFLFSSAWIVYAMDRMFESEADLTRQRHNFHKQHRTIFLWIIACCGVLNCALIWLLPLPLEIYKGGIVLGAASVAYIFQPQLPMSNKLKEWLKNLLVTFVFGSASMLPVWIHLKSHSPIPSSFHFDAMSLYLLTLSSLRSIEAAEAQITHRKHVTSWSVCIVLAILLFLNASLLKWTWFVSALATASVIQWYPRNKLPPGVFDFILILPAAVMVTIMCLA